MKRSSKDRLRRFFRKNAFLLLLLVATVGGYSLGLLLKDRDFSEETVTFIGFPGDLVIRSFYMIVVPLLFCSLVLGVSSLRRGGDARMVMVTIAFFLFLSSFAAIMGAAVGHIVHPGSKVTAEEVAGSEQREGRTELVLDSVLDLLRNIVPSNIFEATFSKEFTEANLVNDSAGNGSVMYRKTVRKSSGVNFMGLLSFGILFGSALAALGDKGNALHEVIEQLNAVILIIMNYFLRTLPLGLFFWMLREGLAKSAPAQLLGYLGRFLATALGCVVFHQFVLLPFLYVLILKRNPIPYHLNLMHAIFTAFGTASSAATLPATVRCAEELNLVHPCVSRFVLPLGMAVHMNGGTFYLALSAIFMAQLEGIELGLTETAIVCMTAFLLLIAAPGTSNSGNPVYFLTVTAAAGIQAPKFISLLISMEWLMERFRTVMNVVADSYVAAFVEHLCRDRLPPVVDPVDNNERATPRSSTPYVDDAV